MVETGWVWGEMGKEALRALEILDSNTKGDNTDSECHLSIYLQHYMTKSPLSDVQTLNVQLA